MLIDVDRLREAPLNQDPFDHIIVPGFIRQDALESVHKDYPDVGKPGSYLLLPSYAGRPSSRSCRKSSRRK
ncbi:MAG: hypothetical protein KAR37_14225 [Alphaproteobacteria bacterium]|nr:hypothetical protein [Alphaproteobacteria bacterium]